jgi:RNA polymerase sigma-B factor
VGVTLLRDWELLQERVMPPLLETPCGTARIWSIGDPTDAVAVAVAFAHASAGHDARTVTVFSSGRDGWDSVNFNTADLRCLAPSERSALFQRRDRHWVPTSAVSDRVRLGEPGGQVDLVTIRTAAGGNDSIPEPILDRLRSGGQLLVTEASSPPAGMKPDGTEDRLFYKEADSSGPQAVLPEDASSTLAGWQRRDTLVSEHIGLARSLARRFSHRGESPDDLSAVAQLALVKAARRYEEDRGTPFAPYATACILGELKRHFRDRAWSFRVPRPMQELYLAAKEAREELGHQLGRSPTVAQVAVHLSVSEEALLEAMEAGSNYRADSLDVPTVDGDRPTDIGVIDSALDRVIDRERLRRLLPTLTREERLMLTRLFFEDKTQQQVADELGVSQMQVSRMLARTVKKLRH